MTEQEILIHAKSYIDKLANGIDPLTDKPVAESDVVNQVRISRCLFFVSGILGRVIDGEYSATSEKKKKRPFYLSAEKREEFAFSESPIPISDVVGRINDLIDPDVYHKLSYLHIAHWLMTIGALELREVDGKATRYPTEQGTELGISTVQRNGHRGEYTVVVYNKEAQRFILDHLDAILADAKRAKASEKGEKQGNTWSEEEEKQLFELFRTQTPVSEIAKALQRSEEAVRSRLKRRGLIKHRKDAK